MKWIKKLIIKYYMWKIKRKFKHLQLTPQGQYFTKYIIDFYINETTDEPVERYEKQITEFSKHITLPITQQVVPDELKPFLLHYHAAILMLRSLIVISKNKQEWLDSIKDEDIKKMVSHSINISEV